MHQVHSQFSGADFTKETSSPVPGPRQLLTHNHQRNAEASRYLAQIAQTGHHPVPLHLTVTQPLLQNLKGQL